MKKVLFVMLFAFLALSADSFAKSIKEAKFTTNMTCESCKSKIEKALKVEKGVVSSTADVASKTVTVSYDADITNESAIRGSIAKLGYKVEAAKEVKATKVGKDANSTCDPKKCGSKCDGKK